MRERDTDRIRERDNKHVLMERNTKIHTYNEPFQGTRQKDTNGMRERETKHMH